MKYGQGLAIFSERLKIYDDIFN